MGDRYLTTSESSAWLLDHYGTTVGAHTLRRLAKSGKLKAHRTRKNSWYTFTRESLAAYAESQGIKPVS